MRVVCMWGEEVRPREQCVAAALVEPATVRVCNTDVCGGRE